MHTVAPLAWPAIYHRTECAPARGPATRWLLRAPQQPAPALLQAHTRGPAAQVPENFIPLRYSDLRDLLVASHPQTFASAQARAQFALLASRLSLRNQIR